MNRVIVCSSMKIEIVIVYIFDQMYDTETGEAFTLL
jgi:hypothetical protein